MNEQQILDVADHLAQPTAAHLPTDKAWWRQSLAHGVPGIALLHTELAAAGLRPWNRVHRWLTFATSEPVTAGPDTTGLFYGAPAVAFALAGAATARPAAYRSALAALDAQVAEDTRRRVARATARIAAGELPVLAEFDTLRGLSGVGAYLLRRDPGGSAVHAVLDYLVALSRPLRTTKRLLPGWWTASGPSGRAEAEFVGGHGNFGLAHGVSGPLALLSLATVRGVRVPGQTEAIATICTWTDAWRRGADAGPRWPYMITRDELDTRPELVRHSGANRRPSWCYGTAGLARVQQLAALATADAERQHMAESALASALTDPDQRDTTVDASICHGYAGLARITAHATADASGPVAARLRDLMAGLLAHTLPTAAEKGPGLLEGTTGVAMAALAQGTATATGWDSCLLIT